MGWLTHKILIKITCIIKDNLLNNELSDIMLKTKMTIIDFWKGKK
jgi:hypothetical protein